MRKEFDLSARGNKNIYLEKEVVQFRIIEEKLKRETKQNSPNTIHDNDKLNDTLKTCGSNKRLDYDWHVLI